MPTQVATTPHCHACLSTSLRSHPASHRTGFVIHECRDCGLRALADREVLADLIETYDNDEDTYAAWVDTTRTHVIEKSHTDTLQRISDLVGAVPDRSLFDVGAGDGSFLAKARDAGFETLGNELSPGAIEIARSRHDVEVLLGDLSVLDDAGLHQAVTMWCVLAHVPDGDQLLRDALALLEPGGVLYMQTPRWSGMDTAGMAAHDLSRGRVTHITDRRLAGHHIALHTVDSMRITLERLGYEIISIEPRSRYSLTTSNYLESMRVPARIRERLARTLDQLVERDLFFRNVLDVYARRPLNS